MLLLLAPKGFKQFQVTIRGGGATEGEQIFPPFFYTNSSRHHALFGKFIFTTFKIIIVTYLFSSQVRSLHLIPYDFSLYRLGSEIF